MVHSLKKAGVILIIFWFANLTLSEVSVRTQEQTPEFRTDNKDFSSIRAYMRRVQAAFDETNDSMWFRVAFVATVTEIRSLRESDKLVGSLSGNESDVAVLRIQAVGMPNHATLKEGKVIVCPVGKLRDQWLRWHGQKTEVLLEFNQIGKREHIEKFGC